jgi:hypothetical protein
MLLFGMAYKSKEERNAAQRKRYAENEHVRKAQQEATKRWLEKHPREYQSDSRRGWTLQYRYGISVEDYEAKLAAQNKQCKLCPATQDSYERRLCVDHDHDCCPGQRSCGKCLRGILCANCNRKIGFLEEILCDGIVMPGSDTWSAHAINYIESYKK